jgi:uncharacterized OB-fold protein
MEFGKFGIKSFTSETKVSDFVTHLEQGRLMTTKCRGCGKLRFPPRAYCPECGDELMDWVEMETTGRIVTFTTVYYGPAGFEDKTPYTIAIAEFPGGIQITGHIDGSIPGDRIRVGMKVRVVPVTRENRWWYQFEMAEQQKVDARK